MLGQSPNKPYVSTQPQAKKTVPSLQGGTNNVIGSQAVRPTSGPYDPAYRQNLATYAGGTFERPNGFLNFNPTGALFGQPVGGGSAPVMGMPTDLLTEAMGQQQMAPSQPKTQPEPKKQTGGTQPGDWRFWLNDFSKNGTNLRLF